MGPHRIQERISFWWCPPTLGSPLDELLHSRIRPFRCFGSAWIASRYDTAVPCWVRRNLEGNHLPSRIAFLLSLLWQYCNELSMTIELDSTLAQAEVLFLSFSQVVSDIDRRRRQGKSHSNSNLRNRNSTPKVKTLDFSGFQISDELRELLSTVDKSRSWGVWYAVVLKKESW